VWPVSRGCSLLRGTWSYLRICRRSVLPYTRFCNCLSITITFCTLLNSLFLYHCNGHRTCKTLMSNKTAEIYVASTCRSFVYFYSKMWNLYFKFQYLNVDYTNVVHENDFNNSNVMKSVELRRCIHLYSRLYSNQIAKLPAGIFDQLVKLQDL
jgi:hypothetical protein